MKPGLFSDEAHSAHLDSMGGVCKQHTDTDTYFHTNSNGKVPSTCQCWATEQRLKWNYESCFFCSPDIRDPLFSELWGVPPALAQKETPYTTTQHTDMAKPLPLTLTSTVFWSKLQSGLRLGGGE